MRPKTTYSCRQLPKVSRPTTSHPSLSQKPRPSGKVKQIISNLEQNIGELKQCYEVNGRPSSAKGRHMRSSGGMKRGHTPMLRRPSADTLQKGQVKSAGLADVFELRREYQKINGSVTNNIIQLYQLYTHLAGKQDKSTRIMASMEMSNGWSISGKDSLIKHSQSRPLRKQSKEPRKDSLIEEQSEPASFTHQPPLQTQPISKKTSMLANDLLSKKCFNIANVANLLSSKHYRLSKDKEKSLRNNDKQNVSNNANQLLNHHNVASPADPVSSEPRSPTFHRLPSISTQKVSPQPSPSLHQSKQSPALSGKKRSARKERVAEGLSESPIVGKGKEFASSKYYVQPIPVRREGGEDSLSLECNSKIIDIDCVAFDFE